ncbi:hypothetical protein MHH81_20725 [Psychrobacillus sp. FSL H8-0484]|uniref:hypothetical protein n=1 Tax=Psychrobacillus sp. FSL H8-0484 TaxID=2921390 RepID=UPI0030FD0693
MGSDNTIIAKDIYSVMLGKEVSMTLRSMEKTTIRMFIRFNTLNKFNYEELNVDALKEVENEEEEYCEMPKEIYENACLLISKQVESIQFDLNYKTIEVSWNYDKIENEFTSVNYSVLRELHRNGSMTF